MPRSRLLRVGIVASLAAACGGRDPASPVAPLTPADVAGTYALRTIDTQRLPWPWPKGDGTTLVADTITYAADGTWTEVEYDGVVGSITPNGTARYGGTWTLDVQSATLHEVQLTPPTTGTADLRHVEDRGARLTLDTGNPTGRLWTWVRLQ